MANKDRTEIISQIAAYFPDGNESPAENLRLFIEEMANSMNFRKDLIRSRSGSGGTYTVDFASYDTEVIADTAGNLTITVTTTAIENGEFDKTLILSKGAGYTLTLQKTDTTAIPISTNAIWNSYQTTLVLRIYSKNGVFFAQNMRVSEIAGWQEVGNDGGNTTLLNGWVQPAQGTLIDLFYRINAENVLQLFGRLDGSAAIGTAAFGLPAAYVPALFTTTKFMYFAVVDTTLVFGWLKLTENTTLDVAMTNGASYELNVNIPMD